MVLSEINFVKKEVAQNRIDTIFKRLTSRFERTLDYFGMIILDSSAQGSSSVVDEFMENNPYDDRTLTVRASRWEVRSHLNYYGQHGWFYVYAGDNVHAPFFIDEAHPITEEHDPDRVIKVPEECRNDFEMNIETALQDLAGVSTNGTDAFFSNPEIITKSADLPRLNDDVIIVDFNDKTDDIMYYVRRAIETIPKERKLYIRVDLGTSSDSAGIAIAYIDHLETFKFDAGWNNSERVVRMPVVMVPIAFAMSRKGGEQTPLWHIEKFLMDLSKEFEIGLVAFDQYQSTMILQDLKREGINCQMSSLIRSDEPFVTFKNMMMNGCIHLPYNENLIDELARLKRQGNKVVGDRKKLDANANSHCDTAESVIGAVYHCFMDADNAIQLSSVAKIEKQNKILNEMLNKGNEIQNLVQSVF